MSAFTASIPTADWSGPHWWFVFFPLVWFGFFFLLFFVLRRFGPWGCGWGPGYGPRYARRGWAVDPSDVLDRRFAEGEIDAEEYRSRRSTLERDGGS
jgi:putative membrane protein